MSRPVRLDPEHGIHHVYSRGTRRWTLFIDDLDYERFLQRLGVVCERYGTKVYAYCLMGNHFHLIVYCPQGQLSAMLRDLKSAYARMHNVRHGFSGPLFESRFGSKLVDSYEYLYGLTRYIHRNPVAMGPSISLREYRWSSYAYFLLPNAERPEWLDVSFPLSFFASVGEYRSFVERNVPADESRYEHVDEAADTGIFRHQPAQISLSKILVAISEIAGCPLRAIRPRSSNGLIGVAALVAAEVAGYTASELADPCGFTSATGVYNSKAQTRRRLTIDPDLRATYELVMQHLGAKPDQS